MVDFGTFVEDLVFDGCGVRPSQHDVFDVGACDSGRSPGSRGYRSHGAEAQHVGFSIDDGLFELFPAPPQGVGVQDLYGAPLSLQC